jgi:hypothetical protein
VGLTRETLNTVPDCLAAPNMTDRYLSSAR